MPFLTGFKARSERLISDLVSDPAPVAAESSQAGSGFPAPWVCRICRTERSGVPTVLVQLHSSHWLALICHHYTISQCRYDFRDVMASSSFSILPSPTVKKLALSCSSSSSMTLQTNPKTSHLRTCAPAPSISTLRKSHIKLRQPSTLSAKFSLFSIHACARPASSLPMLASSGSKVSRY